MPALPRLSRSIGTGPPGRSVIPASEASRDYAFLIASAVVGCKRQDRLGVPREAPAERETGKLRCGKTVGTGRSAGAEAAAAG